MSVMMNPVLPVPGPQKLLKNNTGYHDNADNSFAGHLNRRLDEKTANRDKLGVADRNETKSRTTDKSHTHRKEDASEKEKVKTKSAEEDYSLAALLAEFMEELQAVAGEQPGVSGGEWNVGIPDMEAIKQLAADAGMTEMELTDFYQQFVGPEKKISLTDFFTALQQYFAGYEETPAITVPESELPMLETILSRMGLPQDVLDQLSAQAVDRDGVLDLTGFFKKLQEVAGDDSLDIKGLTAVDLSDWEVEQLQNLLDQAGVTLEKQNELLPERLLDQVSGRFSEEKQPVSMTLERLTNILKQGINEVRINEPELKLSAFLNDLKKIVSQSGFESKSAGWTPVVQETIDTVFQKLQEIVDLAQVKATEDNLLEDMALEADYGKWVKDREEKFADLTGRDADFSGEGFSAQNDEAFLPVQDDEESPMVRPLFPQHTTTISQVNDSHNSAAPEAAHSVRHQPVPHRLQQQVIQQLSAGVMRGLRNQEHHLILRLYPQDMGEVKVDLTVRDEQVSVSFNMENSRVKEMLESNMDDFKDSMNRQGFTLGECSVSVGYQGNENNDLRQHFVMNYEGMAGNREPPADLPDDVLYHQAVSSGRYAGNGISLLV